MPAVDDTAASVTWADVISAIPGDRVVDLIEHTSADATQVAELTDDSRQVVSNGVFACVRGANFDGHRFADAAVAAGAVALIVDHPLDVDVNQLVVDDVRRVVGFAAAAVHRFPARALTMVGVTGTNGKTTTTQMIAAIIAHTGKSTATIGTLSGARTTPEAADLQRQLRQFADDGVTTVVMEVSSHALAMSRVNGVVFDVATFTNLGLDHLDLHGSVDDYFRAKAELFTPALSRVGVVNADDTRGRLLIDTASIPIVAFSADQLDRLDVGAQRIGFTWSGVDFDVPIGGTFNVANLHAAIVTVAQLGIEPAAAAAGLATLGQVPGRFEVVSSPDDDITTIVDYAHTPDGLTELLHAVRDTSDGNVVVVFGCGGDRDQSKRPLMGRAAGLGADLVIVTSDNPRHEDPIAIIDAIVAGVPSGYREGLTTEPDRRRAIELAVARARRGDVVVVAGKGHETTQTTGDTSVHFDDREVAREALAQRRHTRATSHADGLPAPKPSATDVPDLESKEPS